MLHAFKKKVTYIQWLTLNFGHPAWVLDPHSAASWRHLHKDLTVLEPRPRWWQKEAVWQCCQVAETSTAVTQAPDPRSGIPLPSHFILDEGLGSNQTGPVVSGETGKWRQQVKKSSGSPECQICSAVQPPSGVLRHGSGGFWLGLCH